MTETWLRPGKMTLLKLVPYVLQDIEWYMYQNLILLVVELIWNYNIARELALYKSDWAAMNKIFIYARQCVDDVSVLYLPGCKVVVF